MSTIDRMVEAQLCKLRDTSDTLVGRIYILSVIYSMVFEN